MVMTEGGRDERYWSEETKAMPHSAILPGKSGRLSSAFYQVLSMQK
jgi:hypothetical protein